MPFFRKKRNFKVVQTILVISSLLAFLAITFFLVSVQILIRAYKEFNYEKPVAIIIVKPTGNQEAHITLIEKEDKDSSLVKKNFLIHGDQWILEGDVLKWKPYLNFLGLHARYRLTRIEGRYLKIRDEKNNPRSLFALAEESRNDIWGILYDIAPKLPFVETVYGSAAYQFSDKERIFLVYVTDSGFIIKRKSDVATHKKPQ
jgi:hypothetical protein